MAQLPKGGLVRGQDKPIHGSCAIYFPGGIGNVFKHVLFQPRENDPIWLYTIFNFPMGRNHIFGVSNWNDLKFQQHKKQVVCFFGYRLSMVLGYFCGVITPGHHHEHPCLTVYNGGPRDGWWLRGSVVPCNEKPGLPWLFSVFLGDEIRASYVGIFELWNIDPHETTSTVS